AFILRIEDTDVERNRDEWSDGIISAMHWLELDFDEGPFFQSELLPDHVAAAEALYANGYLYACDCTREQIDERIKGNAKPGYDGYCRDRHLERSEATALRFRVPDEGTTVVHDVIRGEVTFTHDSYEDFVVVKSNGIVLYPLANAVDDRSMGITHIIRGEDLLPTTPKQVLMWEALNNSVGVETVALPLYAHLPMLVNEQRKKLSKRKDDVALESYRDQGFLPEAFVNYLALLGWSPRGDDEIVPRATLVEQFRLEDVSHSPAFFDVKKLTHINGTYIRAMTVAQFIDAAQPWLDPQSDGWSPTSWRDPDTGAAIVSAAPWATEHFDGERFAQLASVVQERVEVLGDVPALVDFLFLPDAPFDEESWQKAIINDDSAPQILGAAHDGYSDCEWTHESIKDVTQAIADAVGKKLGKAQAPIRVATMGRTRGLPLFDSLEVLGRDETLRRIEVARARIAA
ncbi:MAG TPA: glutamate--tRNA ligase, partial [Acidimicrobiales bacterium]|nr:glutamate--tRNA ligase [Acidimicrobiales bacterium]